MDHHLSSCYQSVMKNVGTRQYFTNIDMNNVSTLFNYALSVDLIQLKIEMPKLVDFFNSPLCEGGSVLINFFDTFFQNKDCNDSQKVKNFKIIYANCIKSGFDVWKKDCVFKSPSAFSDINNYSTANFKSFVHFLLVHQNNFNYPRFLNIFFLKEIIKKDPANLQRFQQTHETLLEENRFYKDFVSPMFTDTLLILEQYSLIKLSSRQRKQKIKIL